MKNEDLMKESIHLILNYHGRSVIVKLKKYKTLVHVKQKVFDLFYPVKHNINIYSNNKNLEPLVNQPIGYIFSGQSLVNLNVLDEGVIDTPYKLINRYQDTFYTTIDLISYSRRNLNFQKKANKTNSTSLSKINTKRNSKIKMNMLNKNNLFKLKSELMEDNNISNIIKNKNNNNNNKSNSKNNSKSNKKIVNNKKMFNSSSVDNLKSKKYQNIKIKLPPIVNNKSIKNTKKVTNKLASENILYNKCNDCYINKISIYCRTCDKFLCNNCALNKKSYHVSHKENFIKIIQNSNQANIKQYKKLINKQLEESLSFFDKLNNNKKEKQKNNDEEIEEEENEEKEEEKDNNNDIENNKEKNNSEQFDYNDIITKISDNIYKLVDHATDVKNNMKEIDFEQIQDSNDEKIQNICENEKIFLKKMNLNDYVNPFYPFYKLNEYERNMAKYFNNYGVNSDERISIKTKIELLFQTVENEVDSVLTEIDNIIGDKELLV